MILLEQVSMYAYPNVCTSEKKIFVRGTIYTDACIIYIYKTTILKIQLIAKVENESDYIVNLTSFTSLKSK